MGADIKTERLCRRLRSWQMAAAALVLLLHASGSSAQHGLSPAEAEEVSSQAQEAAAAAVAREQVHDADGGVEDVIYSQDGTWTLPATALAAGSACKPHCTGVCMEHCQFEKNPATGVVEDTAPCAADCKAMCKQGCKGQSETGGEQGDSFAEDAAKEAQDNEDGDEEESTDAGDEEEKGATEQGGKDGEDDGDDENGENAETDGVGPNDGAERGEMALEDCIPVCLQECLPQCERASTQDPHICKGDCNSYCDRDCKLDQGVGAQPLPEDHVGASFEYMSVDDAVLPHQSPKMDSRDMGPAECEPHCNSECLDECGQKYHTPERCPDECKKDCYNYCKPLYGKLNNVGDKLLQESEDATMRTAPQGADDTGLSQLQGPATRDVGREQEDTQMRGGREDALAGDELNGGGVDRAAVKKGARISPSSRYFGGNPAVQWLAASVGVLMVMGVVGFVVQRRIGGGKIYMSVPSAV